MTENKIFGIGLPRTGTTSLAKALRLLGYGGKNYCLLNDNGTTDKSEQSKRFIAFDVNNSFYKNYEQLYFDHKQSKFILTTRDSSSWKNSVSKILKSKKSTDHCIVLPNITNYIQEVMKFFNDRGSLNQLLVVDLFDTTCDSSCKWKNLCDFLTLERPESLPLFPHIIDYWEYEWEHKIENNLPIG